MLDDASRCGKILNTFNCKMHISLLGIEERCIKYILFISKNYELNRVSSDNSDY